jgi:hypothetical protein
MFILFVWRKSATCAIYGFKFFQTFQVFKTWKV